MPYCFWKKRKYSALLQPFTLSGYEKNISALAQKTQKRTRFPQTHGYRQWPQGFGCPQKKGQKKTYGVGRVYA